MRTTRSTMILSAVLLAGAAHASPPCMNSYLAGSVALDGDDAISFVIPSGDGGDWLRSVGGATPQLVGHFAVELGSYRVDDVLPLISDRDSSVAFLFNGDRLYQLGPDGTLLLGTGVHGAAGNFAGGQWALATYDDAGVHLLTRAGSGSGSPVEIASTSLPPPDSDTELWPVSAGIAREAGGAFAVLAGATLATFDGTAWQLTSLSTLLEGRPDWLTLTSTARGKALLFAAVGGEVVRIDHGVGAAWAAATLDGPPVLQVAFRGSAVADEGTLVVETYVDGNAQLVVLVESGGTWRVARTIPIANDELVLAVRGANPRVALAHAGPWSFGGPDTYSLELVDTDNSRRPIMDKFAVANGRSGACCSAAPGAVPPTAAGLVALLAIALVVVRASRGRR
jgi:hypothetical protein